MKEEMFFDMDGRTIGIAIYSYKLNEFVKNRFGEIMLFKNERQAKVYAAKWKRLVNPLDYQMYIFINDSQLSIDHFDQLLDGRYMMYTDDNKICYVKPVDKFIVERNGYIIFNNNEHIENFDEGKKVAIDNFTAIRNAANSLVKYPNKKYTLESVGRSYNNMILRVKNTSGIINILYNTQIININQSRKNRGLRSFRFDKEMDKYNSLYFFIEKESGEPEYFNTIDTCEKVLNDIIDRVRETKPEVQLKYIELIWPIKLEKDIICQKKGEES